jgi:hypothetical protein
LSLFLGINDPRRVIYRIVLDPEISATTARGRTREAMIRPNRAAYRTGAVAAYFAEI